MAKSINLQLGWPSTYLFPRKDLLKASQETLSDDNLASEALIYGPDPGFQPLRKSIAEWLTRTYQPTAGPTIRNRIFIFNGASAGLGAILDRFTDPIYTKRVWMVEPTYFLACPIIEDAGFVGQLRGVPEDDEGIDIDYLRHEIEKVEQETRAIALKPAFKFGGRYPKIYKHIIYTVPTFSNPSAKTMSLRRRTELVALARQYDALIITDDVYDLLRWPTTNTERAILSPPPPRLVDIDRGLPGQTTYGNTVSNGSFSKIVAPGVRVSWMEGTIPFIEVMAKHGATCSGGSPGHLASVFVHTLLTSGALEAHLQNVLNTTYAKRYTAMMGSIDKFLVPLGVTVTTGTAYQVAEDSAPQAGGFFTYITLPESLPSAEDVAKTALKYYRLKVAHGGMMTVAGDKGSVERAKKSFGRGIRLSWSWHDEEEIREGVERLAKCIRDMQAGTVPDNDTLNGSSETDKQMDYV